MKIWIDRATVDRGDRCRFLPRSRTNGRREIRLIRSPGGLQFETRRLNNYLAKLWGFAKWTGGTGAIMRDNSLLHASAPVHGRRNFMIALSMSLSKLLTAMINRVEGIDRLIFSIASCHGGREREREAVLSPAPRQSAAISSPFGLHFLLSLCSPRLLLFFVSLRVGVSVSFFIGISSYLSVCLGIFIRLRGCFWKFSGVSVVSIYLVDGK